MKAFKLFSVFYLFVLTNSLFAQYTAHSRTGFNYIDLLNYTSFCKNELAFNIKKEVDKGKIKLYKDIALENEMNYNEFFKLITVKDYVQIPNPANPDDIYDLIDTVIYDEVYPSDFIFHNNKVVEFSNAYGAKVFLKYKQVKKVLDDRQLSLIKFYKKHGLELIADKTLLPFCKKQVSQVGKRLYQLGTEGKIKCHNNDSLSSIITSKEIIDWTSIRVNKQVQNPENPEDPYDLIDTVITYDYNPDSINTIRVYFEWENEKLESQLKMYSIAPLYKPFVGGIELPLTPVFHVKASTYKDLIDKGEERFWGHFYTFLLKNKASSNYFNYFDENDLPEEN